jgi:hypothetical protein
MTQGIIRRGGQLLRPMGPWSEAVHEYLRHLESTGFDGAPRFLGIEGDREVLTFVEGEVAADPKWQPGHEQLCEARFDSIPHVPSRLRLFVDAYGVSNRRAILLALHRCKLLAAERIKYWPVAAAEAADALECHVRELRWLHTIAPELDRTL